MIGIVGGVLTFVGVVFIPMVHNIYSQLHK